MNPTDPFESQHAALVQVHGAITAALEKLMNAASSADWLREHATQCGRFVLLHHQLEDTVLFPTLRELGAPGTVETFLVDRDREHRAIHTLAARLAETSNPSLAIGLGGELLEALRPHTHEEEQGLAPANLRRILTLDGLGLLRARLEASAPRQKTKTT